MQVVVLLRVGIVLICTATVAHAQWSAEHLREFTDPCVESCRKGGTNSHNCSRYCACVAKDLQAHFPDADAFGRDFDIPNSAAVKQVNTSSQACRRRIFGQ